MLTDKIKISTGLLTCVIRVPQSWRCGARQCIFAAVLQPVPACPERDPTATDMTDHGRKSLFLSMLDSRGTSPAVQLTSFTVSLTWAPLNQVNPYQRNDYPARWRTTPTAVCPCGWLILAMWGQCCDGYHPNFFQRSLLRLLEIFEVYLPLSHKQRGIRANNFVGCLPTWSS